jgi:DNA polymerase I-like protein with 3'-5' exonuclease and polymerase domains
MTTAVVDIETNGLKEAVIKNGNLLIPKATKIHCIVAKCYDTGRIKTWVEEECKQFAEWSKLIDTFIMHNGLSFDAPLLNKFTNSDIKPSQIRDTLLESQLFNPVREDGHGLEAWGKRLNKPKGDVDSFEEYTPDMLEYCKQDTEITYILAKQLEDDKKKFSDQSLELERKVRQLLDQQEENGFALNLQEAMKLNAQLSDELYELEQWSLKTFEPTIIELKTKTKEIPFNIASRQQIGQRLMDRGWKPTVRTEKDHVVVNEAVLKTITEPDLIPLAKKFIRYFLIQKRSVMITSWITACRENGRVHGKVMTLRTVTGRMAHHSPNMAQIPAVYSEYGKECRSLWTVSNTDTHKLVGTDASGLELRCLAHYLRDDNYKEEILNGDIHTKNMELAGIKDRDQAKTFIYAFLYGAGSEKIGSILGLDKKAGTKLINRFLANLPSLRRLRSRVEKSARSKTLRAIDGRILHIRSVHSALNTLLQGAGAIICKQWLVHMMDRVKQKQLDVKLVGSIHDEYQFEVINKDVESFCKITQLAIKDTEKTLQLRCPLDSEYKVGRTWAETH